MVGDEVRQIAKGMTWQGLQALSRTLALIMSKMESHWKILS